MNSSESSNALLEELHHMKVEELIPLFITLGCLMLFGLLGNASVLVCMCQLSKKSMSSFFLQVLAVLDILVCLSISLTIFNYSQIYIISNNIVCKLYVFSKFTTSLFSGYVLLVIAAYRYMKICHPMRTQLSLKGAKISIGVGISVVLLITAPQLYVIDIVQIEVQKENNVTMILSDCISKALVYPGLKAFTTVWDKFCLFCFIVLSSAMIVSYALQAVSIVKFNQNRMKLRQNSSGSVDVQENRNSVKAKIEGPHDIDKGDDHSNDLIAESPERQTSNYVRDTVQCGGGRKTRALNKTTENAGLVSMGKVTVMFSIISLGFILTFLPYVVYAVWRNFHATIDDFPHPTDAFHLFVLNSYTINSIINPLILIAFNDDYRLFLCRYLCKCRRQ